MCFIKDQHFGQVVGNIQMAKNQMFPLEISRMKSLSLLMTNDKDSTKWHLRYRYLNIKGLKLLGYKKMIGRCGMKLI